MSAIDEYTARAQQNAPKTPAEVAAAACELANRGFSDHTVAAILRIDVEAIRQMIGERSR